MPAACLHAFANEPFRAWGLAATTVAVHCLHVGNAPQLRTKLFKLERSARCEDLIKILRTMLKLPPSQTLVRPCEGDRWAHERKGTDMC